MKINPLHLRCPGCQGPLVPVALHCEACEVTVEGRFASNEFAALSAEELHFLRIFVHCEGSIREMESALGVSYPTIKSRLAKLKTALVAAEGQAGAPQAGASGAGMAGGTSPEAARVLGALEAGEITAEEAILRIRQASRGAPGPNQEK